MISLFELSLNEIGVDKSDQDELLQFLRQLDEKVCVRTIDDAEAMGTIEEVQSSKLFSMLINDLMERIGKQTGESYKIFT